MSMAREISAPSKGMWHSRLGCVNHRRDACATFLHRLVSQARVRSTAERASCVGQECPTSSAAGFTLVEVLAAVAIMGGALFILLNTHHGALRLYADMNESVVKRQLLERVVGEAEFGVLTGELTGSGEFKGRYAEYSWSYQGTPAAGEDTETPMPFYQVEATLRTPDGEDETLTFYVFNIGSNEVLEGKR